MSKFLVVLLKDSYFCGFVLFLVKARYCFESFPVAQYPDRFSHTGCFTKLCITAKANSKCFVGSVKNYCQDGLSPPSLFLCLSL